MRVFKRQKEMHGFFLKICFNIVGIHTEYLSRFESNLLSYVPMRFKSALKIIFENTSHEDCLSLVCPPTIYRVGKKMRPDTISRCRRQNRGPSKRMVKGKIRDQ